MSMPVTTKQTNKQNMLFCVYVCLCNQITWPGSLSMPLSPACFGCIATIGRIKGMQRNGGHLAFNMFECFPTSHYLYFRFTKEETEPREIKAFAQSLMKLSGSEVHTVTTMVGSLQNVPESAHSWLQGRASVLGSCLFFCPKGLYRVAQEGPYLTPSSP